MSAGRFEPGRYEAISGTIYPVRAQPETKELTIDGVANDYPAGPTTTGVSRIRLRKGKRAFGPAIRTVTVVLTADGTGETAEYQEGSTHVVPLFAQATYDAYEVDQVGTYLGIACRVVGLFPSK